MSFYFILQREIWAARLSGIFGNNMNWHFELKSKLWDKLDDNLPKGYSLTFQNHVCTAKVTLFSEIFNGWKLEHTYLNCNSAIQVFHVCLIDLWIASWVIYFFNVLTGFAMTTELSISSMHNCFLLFHLPLCSWITVHSHLINFDSHAKTFFVPIGILCSFVLVSLPKGNLLSPHSCDLWMTSLCSRSVTPERKWKESASLVF